MNRGINRRDFLRSAGAVAGLALLPGVSVPVPRVIQAKPSTVSLVGAQYPATRVWAYAGTVPGPELRFRQGERLRVELENLLLEDTTVHWHGVRLPNAMDGVP